MVELLFSLSMLAWALDIETLTKWSAFLVTVGGAVIWLYKKSMIPALEVMKNAREAHTAIQKITKELLPDGGGSLRDTIDRIEGRQIVAENRQRAILSETHIGIFETDAAGKCIWVNRTYLKLCGRSLDEIKGNNWVSCVHPEDRQKVFEEWSNCIEQQIEFDLDYRIINSQTKDVIPVKCHSYTILDIKGSVCGYIGTLCPQGKVPDIA